MSGSSTVLLNDLDVTLSDSTNVYYPEISNSNSNFDRLNPVEIIRLSSPSRNTTYKVTISAHILVKTQPYALVISGNIGQHPFTPPERDYTMYILAGILMMGLITGCVLLCVCCMTKKKKDATKVGARLDDDDDEDEESTHREDDSEIHKHQKHSKHHKHSKHQSNIQQKTKTTKKIHPEHSSS